MPDERPFLLTVYDKKHQAIGWATFPSEHIRDIPEALRWAQRVEELGGHVIIKNREVLNSTKAQAEEV